ncbi:MAG: sugar kinase [Rhodobacteraceae bacterium]|nr:MAG: sugar kinase [Paracoccaceae bacterium]
MYLISLNNGERSFSYWRDTSAARLLADDEVAMAAAMESADLIYFSGITLAILDEAARGRFIDALKAARARGRTIAFDPNLRPRLWQSAGQMTAAIMAGAEVSDLVLPSFEDEATHFDDADPAGTAARYLAAGASSVIVKNGADPVHYAHDGARGEVGLAPIARVVDTTSAGDSFNAGYLATEGLDLPLPDRIRVAAALAGQVIGGKGALVPIDRTPLDALSRAAK